MRGLRALVHAGGQRPPGDHGVDRVGLSLQLGDVCQQVSGAGVGGAIAVKPRVEGKAARRQFLVQLFPLAKLAGELASQRRRILLRRDIGEGPSAREIRGHERRYRQCARFLGVARQRRPLVTLPQQIEFQVVGGAQWGFQLHAQLRIRTL